MNTLSNTRRPGTMIVWIFFCCWPPAVWPDFRAGVTALENGDYVAAFREFQFLAEQGDARGQNGVGVMYYHGHGVPQDYVEAARWYGKAAEQGYGKAQFNLGMMYDTGRGVVQDETEAAVWYRKAAEQGIVNAQFNLGQMYRRGQGVPKDYVKAYAWLNLAAAVGSIKAKRNRNILAGRMTPPQLAEGQALAQTLFEKFPPARVPAEQTSLSHLVESIQRKLLALGYEPGRPDGVIGRKTSDAIRRVQKDCGLRVTGEVSDALLECLEHLEYMEAGLENNTSTRDRR